MAATDPDWTRGEDVVCPDCGFDFGRRTAAGTLILTYDPNGLRSRCTRMQGQGSADLRCPRLDEVTAASDRSERANPGDDLDRS
jgi:hypothetical protein